MDGISTEDALADHLGAPRGRGRLAHAPHTGSAGGAPCGDLIRVSIEVDGDRVADAGFDARGCAAALAAASATVELVRGRPALEAARLTPARIADELGGLSPARIHAAALAADAVHRALGMAAADGAVRVSASPRRTLVAMSGGVDSAVAARLALDADDEVVAVTLELWADPAADGTRSCCSPQAVTSARALAHAMGLPHITLDVRGRFGSEVVADFVGEHAAGRTPNPCIRCNGLVRFDVMLALAESLGAARLATGHYARVAHDAEGALLACARTQDKDQSYMLCRLAPDVLERVAFPVGELTKARVRELARADGLPVADKRESQDLCFLAGLGAQGFLERHGPRVVAGFSAERPGDVVDAGGRVLARHGGQHRFTVGQRRGLRLAAGEPRYVIAKDAAANTVTVGPGEALAVRRVRLDGACLRRPGECVDRVKLRYRSPAVAGRVEGAPAAGSYGTLAVSLEEPVHGVAPGQTACLMEDERVIGWGTIADVGSQPGKESVDGS